MYDRLTSKIDAGFSFRAGLIEDYCDHKFVYGRVGKDEEDESDILALKASFSLKHV